MLNNQKGFALTVTLALLPVILAGFFIAGATIGFIQQDLGLKHACRSGGIAGQKQVSAILTRLLDLNPKARSLKNKYDSLQRQLALTPDPRHKAALMIRIGMVQAQRMALDLQQKTLLAQGHSELRLAHLKTQKNIARTFQTLSSSFLEIRHSRLFGKAPRLAVRPDFSDIAPTYSPVPAFSVAQALAHEWQYQVSLAKPYSYFLPGRFQFQKACAVTLKKEGQKWIPQITKAKFSLKSVW